MKENKEKIKSGGVSKTTITLCKLQRRSQTASGPPFLIRWMDIDVTLWAGIRPFVFSSTHYNYNKVKNEKEEFKEVRPHQLFSGLRLEM